MNGNARLSYQCNLPDSAFSIVDGSEFCSQCQTSIVDFTVMSDEEIRRYIAERPGSVCVKIDSDQLNRVKGRNSSFRQRLSIVLTTAFLTLASRSEAQISDTVKTEQVAEVPTLDASVPVPSSTDSVLVGTGKEGMVLDEPLQRKRPLKKKVFLRLSRREFYVMNKAPFLGSRRRGGWRGKF